MIPDLEASITMLAMDYVDIHRDADKGVPLPISRVAEMELRGGELARRLGYPEGFHIAATSDPDQGVNVVIKMGRFYVPGEAWVLVIPTEDGREDPVDIIMWSEEFLVVLSEKSGVDRLSMEMALGDLVEDGVEEDEGNLSFAVPRSHLSRALEITKSMTTVQA